jgi:copper chaperone CopZ
MMHEHEHGTGWFKWTSSALLVILLVNAFVQGLLSSWREGKRDQEKTNRMKNNIQEYRVEGMTCDHCKATVEKGLLDIQGVSEVLADRENSQVRIQAESVPEEQIRETIEKLGYGYGGKL